MSHWEAPSSSDEWYTPRYVFEALGCRFDQDVAATISPYACVPADFRILPSNPDVDWSGFIWMNPPFGGRNGLQPWLERFFAHGNGIALTPDRTSAPWFQYAWVRADSHLFTKKIRFIMPGGNEGVSPSNGTTLWACGERATRALLHARDAGLGILGTPTL